MKRSLLRGLLIVVLGAGLGLVANEISPRGIPLIAPAKAAVAPSEFIPLDQARQLWGSGTAVFLDAREPDDYAAGHIGNALNLPAQSFGEHFADVVPLLTPASEMVVYCDGTECELSHRLADLLRQQGYTNSHVLFNGWTAWSQAGFPTATGGPK